MHDEDTKQNTAITTREELSYYIKNRKSRILELGPLNRPLLNRGEYRNYFFADIRSTEEIKKLYTGNDYLKRTGIKIDLSSIIDIDYVIKGSYKQTFKNVKKFDYVIVSHVLEHIPDILNFFIDIQNVLNKDGQIIILYPDKRFSFDYFRTDSKFSDIYDVWQNNKSKVGSQVLDFYSNVIPENDPIKFWNKKYKVKMSSGKNIKKNLKAYKDTIKGSFEGDAHYWPFSDYGFIKFIRDCKMYDIFPFSLVKFVPTQFNSQEFVVILSVNNVDGLDLFDKSIDDAVEYFETKYYQLPVFQNKIKSLNRLNIQLAKRIEELENDKLALTKMKEELIRETIIQKEELNEMDLKLKSLHEEIVEKTRIKNMLKSIVIKSFNHLKNFFLNSKN